MFVNFVLAFGSPSVFVSIVVYASSKYVVGFCAVVICLSVLGFRFDVAVTLVDGSTTSDPRV